MSYRDISRVLSEEQCKLVEPVAARRLAIRYALATGKSLHRWRPPRHFYPDSVVEYVRTEKSRGRTFGQIAIALTAKGVTTRAGRALTRADVCAMLVRKKPLVPLP
jgi:hypothetical protein